MFCDDLGCGNSRKSVLEEASWTRDTKRKMEDLLNLRKDISAIYATDHTDEDRLCESQLSASQLPSISDHPEFIERNWEQSATTCRTWCG